MVFGRTYCGVSRLPIDDGDEVMAVPLGFQIGGDFDKYNAPDSNAFEWLYYFHSEAKRVVYEGNPSMLKYPNGLEWNEFSLYMIVRTDVWAAIQESYPPEWFSGANDLHYGRTNFKLCELAHKQYMEAIKNSGGNIDDIVKFKHSVWITELIRLENFMCRVGIAPNPMSCVDQSRESGQRYWDVIDKCRANNKHEETEVGNV